jgi:Ca-activated chloride channel family protein
MSQRRLHTIHPPTWAADTAVAGIFPRHALLVFKEAVAMVVLALLAALVVLLLMLAPGRAAAAPTAAPGAEMADPPAGLYFRAGRDDALLEAPTLQSDVVIRVHGEVARAQVRQRFANPSQTWLEGIYVFPLPEGSAVDRLVMTVGERRIEGRILPREEAERVYKKAAEEGRRASLLSSERPNVFVTSVANIGPGETITVEIEYQDRALYRDGRYELRFPMVVAPRYTPAGEAPMVSAPAPALPAQPRVQPIGHEPAPVTSDGEAPGRDLFGPVRRPGGETENRLTLAVHLDAGLPLAKVESLYHAIDVEAQDERRRVIALAEGSVRADRDFVLAWTPATGAAAEAAVFAEQVADDTFVAVTLVPPAVERSDGQGAALPRELIVIVDTSGSMHGPSLEQAQEALKLALGRLRPDDRFNLIRFDSTAEVLFDAPRPATENNLARARAYVAGFRADGGTNMRPALTRALSQTKSPAHLRQIVFLTDGAVSNEQELFSTIAARLEDARLFTVGLGSAPNGYFMRKAAEVGRGTFTFIGKVEDVDTRMGELFRKLESPVLTDVATGWPTDAGKLTETYPAPLPDLYAGETVTFTTRLEGVAMDELDGALLVSGRSGAASWVRRADLGGLEPADGVAALWARSKIARIRDGLHLGHDPKEVREVATDVALAHRLVTVYTSLVAVDDEIARPQDEGLTTREVPRELPEGWNYEKVFGEAQATMKMRAMPAGFMQAVATSDVSQGRQVALPQTATPASQQAVIGLGLAALGLYLLLFTGRLRHARRSLHG